MCPLLAQVLIGFYSFNYVTAINGTNEVNKGGGMRH